MEKRISDKAAAQWNAFIDRAQAVLVATHINPDGDAVGALTALGHYLRARGKQVCLVVPSPHPAFLNFLDPEGEVHTYCLDDSPVEAFLALNPLVIAADLNGFSRMRALGERLRAAAGPKILVDHHLDPDPEGDFDLVFSDLEVSSCCELCYLLFCAADPAYRPSPAEATSLYTGILTDTNRFANSVFQDTFLVVSRLCGQACLDKEAIQHAIFNNYSEDRLRLMGHALCHKLTVLPALGAAYILLTTEEMDRYRYQAGDTEGFVNFPLTIQGVAVSALFTQQKPQEEGEAPAKGDSFRVSLRSYGPFSVSDLAREYFHGGGHFNAAGGRYYGSAAELPAYFERVLRQFVAARNLGHNNCNPEPCTCK